MGKPQFDVDYDRRGLDPELQLVTGADGTGYWLTAAALFAFAAAGIIVNPPPSLKAEWLGAVLCARSGPQSEKPGLAFAKPGSSIVRIAVRDHLPI